MAGLLVLGASGFLGRAVVEEARRTEESPVTGVGRFARGAEDADNWQALDLSEASVATVAEMLASISPSAIINCAGMTAGDRASLVRANVLTVAVLLDALAVWAASPRLVHVGSAAEYASLSEGAATREEDPLEPKTPYGVTKLAASHLVNEAIADGEIDGVVARVFNPLGPGMPLSSMPGHAAHIMAAAAANGLDTVNMGSLEAFRDFVDTRDVAAALLWLARPGRLDYRAFNVASGVARQARDVVSQIAEVVGYKGEVLETAPASPRSGNVAWQRADISRLTRLGWRPSRDMSSSIKALVSSVGSSRTPG